jgi:flagellar hook assembly protein FlgD
LVIYDRWGITLFTSGKPNACWNGRTDAGETVPDGVYYFQLTIGESVHHSYVELLR